MTLLQWWIICGAVGGFIGLCKGNVAISALLGFFLGPLGVFIALCISSKQTCPRCAESIRKNAKLGRYCGQHLQAFKCPHCPTTFWFDPTQAGKITRCSGCNKDFTSPNL